MNAEGGTKACPVVEIFFKHSEDLSYSQKTTERDGIKSLVGCPQICGDKAQLSLSAGAA